jgi:hypothetical protein
VQLIADLQEGSLSTARFVLADSFNRPSVAACILDAGLDAVCGQLIAFALNCAGVDPDAKGDGEAGETTFAEHLDHLYRIATGWLGWTPEVALDSTPVEIREAYKGRLDMLRAIFGGDDADKPTPAKRPRTADELRAAFRELGAKPVKRRA